MSADLDPGVRRLVTWLRSQGYQTTDSGDGCSKQATGEHDPLALIDTPHVVIAPGGSLLEAVPLSHTLLRDVTRLCGGQLPPGVLIQVTYSPQDEQPVLMLCGLDDAMVWG